MTKKIKNDNILDYFNLNKVGLRTIKLIILCQLLYASRLKKLAA